MAAESHERTRTITPREEYHDLTPKMRAVVDAAANNPDAGHKELARIASDELEGDSVSRSYVPAILEQQGHIIEERREIADNRRYEGEERTEGDPFKDLEDGSEGVQLIKDRPVKETTERDASDDDMEVERVQVGFTREDVEHVLSDPETPTWLRERVTEAVVGRAFGR